VEANDRATSASWDEFLERSPLGQFQQSSKWARTKALEGWQCVRVLSTSGRVEEGGFQLLWRRSRFGPVGYVSKGPVLPGENPDAVEKSLQQIRETARQLRLLALIVQPPDVSTISPAALCRHGFSAMPLPSVISATLLVDLEGGAAQIEKRMSRKIRQHARSAAKQGVSVSPGRREHLRTFLHLMQSTCRRQHTKPNPSRPEILEALWDEFAPAVKLSFARIGEAFVAGLLLISFGDRVTFWKKGWASTISPAHANALLNTSGLMWACAQGYRFADFAGFDPDIAQRIFSGRDLSQSQQRSHNMFNLRLGGEPQLLPPGMILVTNRGFRSVFNCLSRFRFARRLLPHFMSIV
jgi:lipid II:glycine glycyltransferase (peptidoglycan interpeptide bridge formation enzyme)